MVCSGTIPVLLSCRRSEIVDSCFRLLEQACISRVSSPSDLSRIRAKHVAALLKGKRDDEYSPCSGAYPTDVCDRAFKLLDKIASDHASGSPKLSRDAHEELLVTLWNAGVECFQVTVSKRSIPPSQICGRHEPGAVPHPLCSVAGVYRKSNRRH
jgi:hypothetical protein